MRSLKERLQAGDDVRVCALGRTLHYNIVQMIGLAGGFHGFWLDMEHVGLTTEQLEVTSLAARAYGMETFCRIPPTDYAAVTRCYEAGMGGVMAAQIFTAEQAEEFVKWAKFAPRGNRGLNTGGYDAQFTRLGAAEFSRQANEQHFLAIQIETLSALEQVEEIAAIDGVDLLFVGPADLSQALGVIGEFFHEKCLAAIDRVAAACRKHNKPWGAVSFNPQHAEMLQSKGCRMLSPTNDTRIVQAGIQAIKQDYAKFFAERG